ncbi:hypothetical protein [Priestia aryabhattai]|uniref:hypothetical protein n=1 Tax=Priestia aryabhattai TaxID=412384 RepID=UPI002E1AC2E2|nr:hypothetical protein [Priestia aryabhattai]
MEQIILILLYVSNIKDRIALSSMASKLTTGGTNMFKKIKDRITNPKVIIALVSGILMILVNLNLIDVQLSSKILDTVNTVLSVLIAVGIFANPESHIEK